MRVWIYTMNREVHEYTHDNPTHPQEQNRCFYRWIAYALCKYQSEMGHVYFQTDPILSPDLLL